MKKIFTLSILSFLFFSTVSIAQVGFGVRAGLNSSNWKGDAANSLTDLVGLTNGYVATSGRTGFHAGGFANIPLGSGFSIEPGVYYSQKGFTMKGDLQLNKMEFLGAKATAQVQSHYIDIPVLVKAEIVKGLEVYAGPQVSILAKNNLRLQAGALGFNVLNRNVDISDNFNTTDVAIAGGLSYTFDNGLSINGGYDHGLSRLDKNGQFNAYNRNFKVGIGFKF